MMYEQIAPYYDAIYDFKDYPGKAERLRRMLTRLHPKARNLLDVGCGTGRHLEALGEHYDIEGLDLSESLLKVARQRLPGIALHHGDMTAFELGHGFDVITCLFGSIGYLLSLAHVRQSIATMARHLNLGGLLLIEPWLSPEAFRVDEVIHNIVDRENLKISWMYVARRDHDRAVYDIHYLVATPSTGVAHITERQELGLYSPAEYLEAIHGAGLYATHHSHGLHGYGLFVCRKDGPWSESDVRVARENL